MSEKERAYAKINLFLDVLSKRRDGFHGVRTVMHTIDIADELEIEIIEDGKSAVTISVVGDPNVPNDENNIVYTAVDLYRKKCGLDYSVRVKLTKNIPSAAGLAGGSSDAAAMLRVLNRVNPNPLQLDDLLQIAMDIGSDVAFCVVGGTAVCEGRGELLIPIENFEPRIFVIAKGKKGVTSKSAYAALDDYYEEYGQKTKGNSDEALLAIVYALANGRPLTGLLYNSFEAVTSTGMQVTGIKDIMRAMNAQAVLMSGSGPAVYGVFSREDVAERVADILRQSGIFAVVSKSVGAYRL